MSSPPDRESADPDAKPREVLTVAVLAESELGSEAQRERRKRILDATMAIASKGGYEAVQMRAVADRADVAVGTLYRYFPSKVHLLVSALGLQPIIATLILMVAGRGLAQLFTDGQILTVYEPASFFWLGGGYLLWLMHRGGAGRV